VPVTVWGVPEWLVAVTWIRTASPGLMSVDPTAVTAIVTGDAGRVREL
jgi:hypothetical protein